MEEKQRYEFTPQEAAFFARQAQEAAILQTSAQAAQRSALLMVLSQQGLQGNWRMAEDGTGLIREETAPQAAPMPPMAQPMPKRAAAGTK